MSGVRSAVGWAETGCPHPRAECGHSGVVSTDSQLSFAERGEGESGGEGGRQRDLPAQSCPETD